MPVNDDGNININAIEYRQEPVQHSLMHSRYNSAPKNIEKSL